MKSSGTQFVGFDGSTFSELATSASFRSFVIAMFDGGPTTEFGTSTRCSTVGGNFEKSKIEIESGPLGGITFGTPAVRSILFSFPEIMICAEAAEAAKRSRTGIDRSDLINKRVIVALCS